MAVPQNKAELLEAINTSYDRLARDLATIPEHLAEEASLDGHVKGSLIRDLV